ncbi:hypothetical protein [Pseudonocardia nigra]|uniref:hypothetical protein n=1 Tax=Pseudonocardia nigra TaxID=1921578 RepID=UPI001C603EA0|nr:hypothetical protein [Pseudonocardia nigra]
MSTEDTRPDRVTAGSGEGGFVPRFDADPSVARYESLTAEQAVERVAAVGFDRLDAELMVGQYLAANTVRYGEPEGGWRVDPYDLAEIARGYEWVDHYRGETIADARARAAGYAVEDERRAATLDRDQDPDRVAQIERAAVVWADRAREEHNPWPVPDSRLPTANAVAGGLIDVEEHAEIEAASNALSRDDWDGDGGPGGGGVRPDPVGPTGPLATGGAAGVAPDQASEAAVPHAVADLNDPAATYAAGEVPARRGAVSGYIGRVQDARRAVWDVDAAMAKEADYRRAAGESFVEDERFLELNEQAERADAALRAAWWGRDPGGATDRPTGQDWAAERDAPDVVKWWAPVGPHEVALTRSEVADCLTERGFTPEQSQAAIARYLDDTSREVGTSVHQWGMDSHDVEAIARAHQTRRDVAPGAAVPVPRTAPEDQPVTPGEVAPQGHERPAPPAADVDAERREQLIRWHADDQTVERAERGTDDPVRVLGGAGIGGDTSDGGER